MGSLPGCLGALESGNLLASGSLCQGPGQACVYPELFRSSLPLEAPSYSGFISSLRAPDLASGPRVMVSRTQHPGCAAGARGQVAPGEGGTRWCGRWEPSSAPSTIRLREGISLRRWPRLPLYGKTAADQQRPPRPSGAQLGPPGGSACTRTSASPACLQGLHLDLPTMHHTELPALRPPPPRFSETRSCQSPGPGWPLCSPSCV